MAWKSDITTLLTIKYGPDRVAFWNGLFSSIEDKDTNFDMDVILYTYE